MPHRVVIVGGGFAGLDAAKGLSGAPVSVTLVDRRNFHLFQPLLYQVATGALSPGEVASPLRYVLRDASNVEVVLAEATGLDVANRRVILDTGPLEYDQLVLATGATHHYFGKEAEWKPLAPGLKTVEDATEIRRRVLLAFELAEHEPDPGRRRDDLSFVIVGGGPTGVELAGALAEIANDTLRHDFRHIDPTTAQIQLIEGDDRLLPAMPPDLSKKAEQQLCALGVRCRTGARVTEITADGVTVTKGDKREFIAAHTVLWAAGVRASRFGKMVAEQTGASFDRAGKVVVEPDLTVPGHPEIYIAGDLASYSHQGNRPLPGVALVAMQQGKYVAAHIRAKLAGRTLPPFHYRDKGNLATIGRNKAVGLIGKFHVSGFPAWFVWVFIHLMYLVEFENRLLVFVEWVYNYITRNRGARLITGLKRGGRDAA